MATTDPRKRLRELYTASARRVDIVDVPAMQFLTIDGRGSPGESELYRQSLEALYPVAYSAKFMLRKADAELDFRVLPLEGLWWADDMNDYVTGRRDRWKWRLMIMQPQCVTAEIVDRSIEQVRVRRNPARLDAVGFETFAEGRAAQVLHVGPFADEGPAIERLHEHIASAGGRLSGRHHEIYLSDARRTAPEKLRTILRQPFVAN